MSTVVPFTPLLRRRRPVLSAVSSSGSNEGTAVRAGGDLESANGLTAAARSGRESARTSVFRLGAVCTARMVEPRFVDARTTDQWDQEADASPRSSDAARTASRRTLPFRSPAVLAWGQRKEGRVVGTTPGEIIAHPASRPQDLSGLSIFELCDRLAAEASALARDARAAQGYVEVAMVAVTCTGCFHPKHALLRCTETPKYTRETRCGCDHHFGLWPDEPGYPGGGAA